MIQKIIGIEEIENLEKILTRTQMDSREVLQRVDEILEEVKISGDKAVLKFTQMYDGHSLSQLRVTKSEFDKAKENIDKDLRTAIENAIWNITRFHEKQIKKGYILQEDPEIMLGQLISPIERVGIYIPGGTASYPSTVMMNVIPARLAGVEKIVIVTPADKDGNIRDSVLVAADILGVSEVYKIGGAQAVGALCYGTETVPKVDKIVGPGNIYVAMAKRKVSGIVGIDMIADRKSTRLNSSHH